MIRLAYLDEEEGWQSTFYYAFSSIYDLNIPEDFPKDIEGLWEDIKDSQIIVADFRLNGKGTLAYTGDDVAKMVHRHNKHLPVIIITSYEDNAIQECEEIQVIRGKEMINTPEGRTTFCHMIEAAVNIYEKNKAEKEKVIQDCQVLISKGIQLSHKEEADKFDAEVYLSELDMNSAVRKNLISSGTSKELDALLSLAKRIVEKHNG